MHACRMQGVFYGRAGIIIRTSFMNHDANRCSRRRRCSDWMWQRIGRKRNVGCFFVVMPLCVFANSPWIERRPWTRQFKALFAPARLALWMTRIYFICYLSSDKESERPTPKPKCTACHSITNTLTTHMKRRGGGLWMISETSVYSVFGIPYSFIHFLIFNTSI